MEQNIQGEDNLKQFRDTHYYVSTNGEIYRKVDSDYIKMKRQTNKDGYLQIGLYENKKQKQFLVHRLVGECFIPNPENKPEINHDDGNKLNNHISNLLWSTRNENSKHAYDTKLNLGTLGEINGMAKLTK